MNQMGAIILSDKTLAEAGQNTFLIDKKQLLSTGIYNARIIYADKVKMCEGVYW